jgi:AraC family transcriptional regulator
MADLNKPATKPGGFYSKEGLPRWYLWDGGYFAIGKAGGEVPTHAHHAIQVFLAFEGRAAIRGPDGIWLAGRGVIVKPDVEHGFNAQDSWGAMLFVDAESAEGLWLRALLTQDITVVPDSRLQTCLLELRKFWEDPLAAKEPGDLIRHCVGALCAGSPPTRKPDARVTKVLAAIARSQDLRLPLEDAAKLVHLSPDRFAHLFKEELGLPFRRYMLWRKLTRAMLAIGRERSIADAAHGSDFADAAHLTRTFNEMFGIPPSVMMRGEFFEIPSPFTQAA